MFSDYKTEFDTWARGFQFSKLDRILTEINRYLQKNNFLLITKFWKMFHFFSMYNMH